MEYDLYDFDGTAYRHESESRFYLYCLLRRPYILPLLPYQLICLLLRFTARGREQWMARFFCFLRFLNGKKLAEKFWERERNNLRPFFVSERRPRPAVVCSASPIFLLTPVCCKNGVTCLVGTDLDPHTGRAQGKILRGAEKVPAIRALLPDAVFVCAYSDKPKLDAPMLALAKEQYHVRRNGEIVRLNSNELGNK